MAAPWMLGTLQDANQDAAPRSSAIRREGQPMLTSRGERIRSRLQYSQPNPCQPPSHPTRPLVGCLPNLFGILARSGMWCSTHQPHKFARSRESFKGPAKSGGDQHERECNRNRDDRPVEHEVGDGLLEGVRHD
eukprot:scaffold220366_cov35-Tisochrysis_lutea.AAC.2